MLGRMPGSGEVAIEPEMTQVPIEDEGDRRARGDRRHDLEPGRRGGRLSIRKRRVLTLVGDVGVIVVLVAAIIFAVDHARPIFAGQPTVVESLTERVPLTKPILTKPSPDTGHLASLLASPAFAADSANFAADLVRTGRMSQSRADSIAYYAVRESYLNGIPPAVVFGVMLTENALFVSGAMSNVGAVGLMQVYPKIWLKELSAKFGKDLATDSTNLKYGVYILGQYIKSDSGSVSKIAVSSGLLHYNGCSHGSFTPDCGRYPEMVRREVQRSARTICAGRDFDGCVVTPLRLGMRPSSD